MTNYENRRAAFRMPFVAEVFCHDQNDNLICSGELKNVSALGVYVVTQDHLPIDTECKCEIVVNGQSSRLIMDSIRAVVVRYDEQGLALRLLDKLEWVALIPILFHKRNKSQGG